MTENKKLTQQLSALKNLQETVAELSKKVDTLCKSRTQQNNTQTGNKKKRTKMWCWSCGITWNHDSKKCKRQVEGHKSEATVGNMMGSTLMGMRYENKEQE